MHNCSPGSKFLQLFTPLYNERGDVGVADHCLADRVDAMVQVQHASSRPTKLHQGCIYVAIVQLIGIVCGIPLRIQEVVKDLPDSM